MMTRWTFDIKDITDLLFRLPLPPHNAYTIRGRRRRESRLPSGEQAHRIVWKFSQPSSMHRLTVLKFRRSHACFFSCAINPKYSDQWGWIFRSSRELRSSSHLRFSSGRLNVGGSHMRWDGDTGYLSGTFLPLAFMTWLGISLISVWESNLWATMIHDLYQRSKYKDKLASGMMAKTFWKLRFTDGRLNLHWLTAPEMCPLPSPFIKQRRSIKEGLIMLQPWPKRWVQISDDFSSICYHFLLVYP